MNPSVIRNANLIVGLMLIIGICGQQRAGARQADRQTETPVVQERHPVRWTRAVGPPSRDALMAKLQRPVKKPSSQRIYEHNEKEREIRTCIDYARAVRNGWKKDANGYERATWSFFEDECAPIALVLSAKPSRVSYVSNFTLTAATLNILPPTLSFSPIGEVEEKAAAAERNGLSWKRFKPELKVIKTGENFISVELRAYEAETKPKKRK